jgi:DNA-nicking Smr family endonuclease
MSEKVGTLSKKHNTMHIGDKVRLLQHKEEGVIVRFKGNDVVEVEIEDGFRLPVLRRELVVVSPIEDQAFKAKSSPQTATPQATAPQGIRAEKGIFMAFVPLNDRELSLHLINNTDWELPYSLSVTFERHCRGLSGGALKPKTMVKVTDLAVKDFDEWGAFTLSCLYYTVGYAPAKEPLVRKIRFRADSFFKTKRSAPMLNKDAYLFQMDAEDEPQKPLSAADLKEKMFEKTTPITLVKDPLYNTEATTVDLHIEKLSRDYLSMNNSQIIDLQIQTFEQAFDKAIANGASEITFIHGVGNGVLKNEIHRRLSGHPHVQYYEDAQKEKFGYGATKVRIK